MLQKLGDHIANCFARAAEAERQAAETSNQAIRVGYETMARSWRHIAGSYQFVESLERFLLDAAEAKGGLFGPPTERDVSIVPPSRAGFGPDTIGALISGYNKAIEDQLASAHEIIAKLIIGVAAEGERDADKLCQGALESMRVFSIP
jgi:hypothetical protein